MTILFTTRTIWNEPQRLRHQLAELLIDMGHSVVFVEKPVPFWKRKAQIIEIQEGLSLVSVRALIHPQLRVLPFLGWIDQKIRQVQLEKTLRQYDFDVHFSFFLDAYGLFEWVPRVQVINDDFIGKATRLSSRSTKSDFTKSVRSATCTLTVSYPLHNLVKKNGGNSITFFPWFSGRAAQIDTNKQASKILYFGYLAGRVRWEIIDFFLRKGITVEMYAPESSATTGDSMWIRKLKHYGNFIFHGEGNINDIDHKTFICSIQPYDRKIPNTDMITFSNRTVRLLALGVPSLHERLPHLIECPSSIIYQASTEAEYWSGFTFLRDNQSKSQKDIASFLDSHDVNARKQQLNQILDDACRKTDIQTLGHVEE